MSPHLGASVTLMGDDGEAISSMVVFSSDDDIFVVVPEEWGVRQLLEGTPFELIWPGKNGAHVLPVWARIHDGPKGKPLWALTQAGDYRFEQRRRYVRLSMRVPMTIANLIGDTGDSEQATLIDVSETSLLCGTSNLEWLDVGVKTPVRVRFIVADTPFVTNGTVLRTTLIGSEHSPKGVRIVVLFDERTDFADALRRSVFEEQRRRIAQERELIARDSPE